LIIFHIVCVYLVFFPGYLYVTGGDGSLIGEFLVFGFEDDGEFR
jgi:hypothetical protein